jgi:hypothetical protein
MIFYCLSLLFILVPVIEPQKTIAILHTLIKEFDDYLISFHHNPQNQRVDEHTLQRIVNILNIFSAFFHSNVSSFLTSHSIEWMMKIFKGTLYENEEFEVLSTSSSSPSANTITSTTTDFSHNNDPLIIRKKISKLCQKIWDANHLKLIQSSTLEMSAIVEPIRTLVEDSNLR